MHKFNFNPYDALKSIVGVTSAYLGKDFLKVVCDELKILFNAQIVLITEAIDYNPTTKVKILYSTDPNSSSDFLLEGTPCKLVYEDNIIQITKGVNISFEQAKNSSFKSFYGIPIHNKENSCIGHIAIFSNKERTIPKEVEDIAIIFARRIETEYERIILEKENKKIMNKLYELTIEDSLTKIYNRRFFTKKCAEVDTQVKRNLTQATIISLDIDDFKGINDNFGHSQGDLVLKEVAKILKKSTRKDIDFVSRIGGEEFGIICLNSDINTSIKCAERIMKKTNDFFCNSKFLVTFSIGIVAFDKKSNSWEDTYALADKKMYESKNNGKNKITY